MRYLTKLRIAGLATCLGWACGKTTDDSGGNGGNAGSGGGTSDTRLTAIACSPQQVCVLDENGHLICWGDLTDGTAPPGTFAALVGGSTLSALNAHGEVKTWGSTVGCPADQDCLNDLPGPHKAVFGGSGLIRYYLDVEGHVSSSRDEWSADVPPAQQVHPDARPGDTFTALTFVFPYVCGLHADGSYLCWSDSGLGSGFPTDDGAHTYARIDFNIGFCGITTGEGTLVCSALPKVDGPSGAGYRDVVNYTQTPPSDSRRCGLNETGDLDCSKSPYEPMVPKGASLEKVCSGISYVCGIRFDGKVSCWGHEDGNFGDDPLILHIPDDIAAH